MTGQRSILLETVLLIEAGNTTFSLSKSLTSCVERMAVRACINFDFL